MQDGVLNLCRVKLRDQQRLDRTGVMKEYPQFPDIGFGEAVPRAGNASGGGQPGWILKCKGWQTDPNAYIYFITQAPVWGAICKVIGEEGWITDPHYATPTARLPHLKSIFARIEEWTMTKTKFEAMDILNKFDIPCGPILSMKEIAEEPSLRATGTVVEVDHPTRGKYLTVGNPIKLSDSPTEVKRSPLLGEHTDEVLAELGLFGRRDGVAARSEDHLTDRRRHHRQAIRRDTMTKDKAKVRQLLDAVRAVGPRLAHRAGGQAGLRRLRHRGAGRRRGDERRRGGPSSPPAWASRS